MHSTQQSQLFTCAGCGAMVSLEDHKYSFAQGEVLCFACAIARNGVYDESNDHWVLAPFVGDLEPAHD